VDGEWLPDMASYAGDYVPERSERSRWTPLTRMLLSGEMTQEKQKQLSGKEKFDRWMINEGYRRMYGPSLAILT
jgi:hypothetical protein